jgi:hypothetical protein
LSTEIEVGSESKWHELASNEFKNDKD